LGEKDSNTDVEERREYREVGRERRTYSVGEEEQSEETWKWQGEEEESKGPGRGHPPPPPPSLPHTP